MHILLQDIRWDCDGRDPVADCNLPLSVLAVNAPDPSLHAPDEVEGMLGMRLCELYGFLHDGFMMRPVELDRLVLGSPYRYSSVWLPDCHAVMDGSPGDRECGSSTT